jgi:hypothetical protein
MAEAVVVNLVTAGSLAAIKVAVDRWRKRYPGGGSIEIEGEDRDD